MNASECPTAEGLRVRARMKLALFSHFSLDPTSHHTQEGRLSKYMEGRNKKRGEGTGAKVNKLLEVLGDHPNSLF